MNSDIKRLYFMRVLYMDSVSAVIACAVYGYSWSNDTSSGNSSSTRSASRCS